MNTVNQTFNWTRFTATLRKEVFENWRAIMFTLLGTYGLLTMVMIIGNIVVLDFDTDGLDMMESMMPQKVVYVILTFAVIIVSSLSFSKLTRKSGRTDMFTSPSSTFEKFVVNGVVYVLGYIVSFFVLAQLADLTRIAILNLLGYDGYLPGPINFTTNLVGDFAFGLGSKIFMDSFGQAYLWLSLLASSGLYLMGSVMWPRLSLLKTFAAIYAVEMVFFIIIGIIIAVSHGIMPIADWIAQHIDSLSTIFVIISIIQIVVTWGLAWYLFKHKDVISLKWWK